MPFDIKEWNDANREKVRLYSVRYRLRKKGLDLPPETLAEWQAARDAKKAATKERTREARRRWAAANKDRKNARYRERYANDPEFRAKEIARREAIQKAKAPTPEQKAERLRAKRERALKASKAAHAKRHAEAMARAATITPPKSVSKQKPKPATANKNFRKPGRLVALSGWMGW